MTLTKRILILMLALLLPLPLLALEPPRLKGRVNDYAGMLSPETVSRLERKLAGFEREQSTQIVVLTIPSLEGDNIDRFAISVGEKWRLGQAGKDNGVILLLARAERKVRIEVGMGLQGVLPDITASQIIRNVMRPHLKGNDFDRGITAGIDAILLATKGEFKSTPSDPPKKKKGSSSTASFVFLLLAAGVASIGLGYLARPLSGVAGAAGLPLAAAVSFSGLGMTTLLILAAVGFGAGWLLFALFRAIIKGGSGTGGGSGLGGGYFGGGGYYGGGGFSGGDDGGDFSGGGGDFDGGGSSDDY